MSAKPPFSIISVDVIAQLWSRVNKVTLDYLRRDGTQERLIREVVDHGAAAAVLPVDLSRGTVLLVSQWRVGAFLAGYHKPVLEACAGLLDGDEPLVCAAREAEEELGYRVHELEICCSVFASPGAHTELIHLFLARYSPEDRMSAGGGLASEGEDITVVELPLSTAYDMIATGEVVDAKTVILLQQAWALYGAKT